MDWTYKEKVVNCHDDLLLLCEENPFGFIYCIHYVDGTVYYGKKNLHKKVTLPALKSGEQRPGSERKGKNIKGKRVYFDVVTKESDWLVYEGSSDKTEGLEILSKEILLVAYSKRELTYQEAKCLFWEEAIENKNCHNANILKLFFRDNIK